MGRQAKLCRAVERKGERLVGLLLWGNAESEYGIEREGTVRQRIERQEVFRGG